MKGKERLRGKMIHILHNMVNIILYAVLCWYSCVGIYDYKQ